MVEITIEPSRLSYALCWEEYAALASALAANGDKVELVWPVTDRSPEIEEALSPPRAADVVIRVQEDRKRRHDTRWWVAKITRTLSSDSPDEAMGIIVTDGDAYAFTIPRVTYVDGSPLPEVKRLRGSHK